MTLGTFPGRNAMSSLQLKKLSWLPHLFLVISILVGSRLFLGFDLRARGRMDVVNSFAMMLFVWLLVGRISHNLARNLLLALTGLLFVLFHLVCNLHFRFFNVHIPYNIYRQWSDVFVVGGDGTALLSLPETMLVIVLPVTLIILAIRMPVKARWPIFAALAIVICAGWINRLTRPVERPSNQMESLPAYLHQLGYIHYTFRFGHNRFMEWRNIADGLLFIDTSLYERRPNEGFTQTPLNGTTVEDIRKYNIILILAESVRAYECGFMGARPGVTPKLDTLSESARIHTNFYANGSQTVTGEMAILCSVYPNPYGTPAYLTNPRLNVVSLPQILKQYGYKNYWLSGYTADFHNKRVFLTNHGVDHIIDRDVLPEAQEIIGWGMSDMEMFDHAYKLVQTFDTPFFLQITTLSNHYVSDEFPVRMSTPNSSDPRYKRYLDGTAYTDKAIGTFLRKILDSELAKDTIILVTGDHGLWLFPKGTEDYFRRVNIYFRTPLLIWGPEDVVTAGRDDTIGSHVDIAPTLLDMLNIRSRNAFLGRSLLNENIDNKHRFVFCLMGAVPFLRQGDNYLISQIDFSETSNVYFEAERMRKRGYRQQQYTVVKVKGDVLHDTYQVKQSPAHTSSKFSKWVDALKFVSGYCIYFDKFMDDQ